MTTPPFDLMSLLLRYPDDDVLAARPAVLAETVALGPSPAGEALRAFVEWWAAQPAGALQREYTSTFDFSRRTALDLTYYTHGDRRQRGLALLALRRRFTAEGLELESGELPDHLPVVLEFVHEAPAAGGALLAEFRPVIELLRMALERAGSPWAGLLAALCMTLPALTDAERGDLARMAKEGPPAESVGLEPFAPPEIMPEPRRAPTACAAATVGAAR